MIRGDAGALISMVTVASVPGQVAGGSSSTMQQVAPSRCLSTVSDPRESVVGQVLLLITLQWEAPVRLSAPVCWALYRASSLGQRKFLCREGK